jgi:hypothetical protein
MTLGSTRVDNSLHHDSRVDVGSIRISSVYVLKVMNKPQLYQQSRCFVLCMSTASVSELGTEACDHWELPSTMAGRSEHPCCGVRRHWTPSRRASSGRVPVGSIWARSTINKHFDSSFPLCCSCWSRATAKKTCSNSQVYFAPWG